EAVFRPGLVETRKKKVVTISGLKAEERRAAFAFQPDLFEARHASAGQLGGDLKREAFLLRSPDSGRSAAIGPPPDVKLQEPAVGGGDFVDVGDHFEFEARDFVQAPYAAFEIVRAPRPFEQVFPLSVE